MTIRGEHSDYFRKIMLLIQKYNNSKYESTERDDIENSIKSSESNINSLFSYEITELFETLDKTTNLYQILVGQIRRHISDLLFCNLQQNMNNKLPCEDIFDIKTNLEKCDEFKDEIRQYFQNNEYNINEVIEKVYDYAAYKTYGFLFKTISESEKEKALATLKIIITELCEQEKIKFEDIEKIGEGGYSAVYGIGDKVIKIGRTRWKWEIPNNPYIVQPIIRKKIFVGKDADYPNLYIEVTERVDTITQGTNISTLEEELYDLYVKLRQIGIIWDDVNFQNVGRLKMEQKNNHSLEELSIRYNEKYKNSIILPAGTLVILDIDNLYFEDEITSKYPSTGLGMQFCMRYEGDYCFGSKKQK